MDLKRIEKAPEAGNYVFCSRWSDRSPKDPWAIGFLEIAGDNVFKLENAPRSFGHCQVITPLQGVLIMGLYPALERAEPSDWEAIIKLLEDEEAIAFYKWFLRLPS